MRNAADTIAKILKADKHSIYKMEDRLSAITGKKEVLEKIIEENNQQVNNRLLDLGVSRNASVKEVHDALISKIEADDNLIFNALGGMVCDSQNDCNKILKLAQKVAASNHGFFLKKEVARKFLFNEPPKKAVFLLTGKEVKNK